jgi:lipopolysaccharide export LptBFGC system permease protein LptF
MYNRGIHKSLIIPKPWVKGCVVGSMPEKVPFPVMLPFTSKLDTYLGGELLRFLAVSIVLVTLIVFFSDTLFDFLREMQDLGLPLGMAFKFLLLQTPSALAFAFPPALFLTILMIYNQLNQRFEIVALRMNGQSLWRLFRPGFLMALLVALLTLFSTEVLVPISQIQLDLLREQVITSTQLKLNKDGITLPIFVDGKWAKLIHANRAMPNHLEGVTFAQRSPRGSVQLIQAETADFIGQQWSMHGVRALSSLPGRNRFAVNHLATVRRPQLMDVGPEALARLRGGFRDSKLTFLGLRNYIKRNLGNGEDVHPKLYTKKWERLAQPLNCFALAFIGFPLALAPPRQSGARGFVYALAALFLLYIVRSVIISLGQGGLLTLNGLIPFDLSIGLATVLPGIVLIVAGIVLIHRKSYEL